MTSVEWLDGSVRFLDQTRLPLEEIYLSTRDYRVIADAIALLRVRGAPAIGVTAGYAVVLAAQEFSGLPSSEFLANTLAAADALAATRPTAVNLFAALDRLRAVLALKDADSRPEVLAALLREARAIHQEDVNACRAIAEAGAALIVSGSSILTHCNAGALATAGIGTALGVIAVAHEQKKIIRVYADETRPLLQGARLTTFELLRLGIETVLVTDSAAATVLRRKMVQAVIVGADRIAANGDVANKIGTYPLAVLASRHHIPFYVAAPLSTVDGATRSGEDIVIEERSAAEVTHLAGTRIAPEGVHVFSPAFDVTPNDLVTAIVTERGVLRAPYDAALKRIHTTSAGNDRHD